MLSQLLKHSLAHIYNSVMQMWEVFLHGVMSGSSVAIILLESSKAFTTHQVKNTSWNRLSILPVKCTEKETPSSRCF